MEHHPTCRWYNPIGSHSKLGFSTAMLELGEDWEGTWNHLPILGLGFAKNPWSLLQKLPRRCDWATGLLSKHSSIDLWTSDLKAHGGNIHEGKQLNASMMARESHWISLIVFRTCRTWRENMWELGESTPFESRLGFMPPLCIVSAADMSLNYSNLAEVPCVPYLKFSRFSAWSNTFNLIVFQTYFLRFYVGCQWGNAASHPPSEVGSQNGAGPSGWVT